MPLPFNSDFYSVLATIFPVVLLSLSFAAFEFMGFPKFLKWTSKSKKYGDLIGWIGVFSFVVPGLVGVNCARLCINALHSRHNLSGGMDGLMVFVLTFLLTMVVVSTASGFVDKSLNR